MNNSYSIIEAGIPYIGLRSYTKNESSYFWGRDDEIEKSTHVILNNVSSMLFGPSGCGKTSLINAGIIPALKTYQYHSIYIRPRECINDGILIIWKKIGQQIDEIICSKNLKSIAKYK